MQASILSTGHRAKICMHMHKYFRTVVNLQLCLSNATVHVL